VPFYEGDTGGTARQCFQTQRAGAGEQIQTAGARDARRQPVKQGFADAIRRRAQLGARADVDATAAPLATDDAQGVRLRPLAARHYCCVPPTVIASMRSVGWPTPTGTFWPCL